MKYFELRSDTFTTPCPHMRRIISEAEVGDDVYGEDKSVNYLQDLGSRITGKEASLFVPSGTMANLIALYIVGGRGNEVLMHEKSHIIHHEVGGAAAIAGIMPISVPGHKGIMKPSELEKHIKKEEYDIAHTSLIEIENTHNFAGGTYWRKSELIELEHFARQNSLAIHMDGARMFNAVIASGLSASEMSSYTDTLTFCLSKGLGAPVGSLLCGSKDFIYRAKVIRKMIGGGMRQIGMMAAAGTYALENNIDRLKEDHNHCKEIALALNQTTWAQVDMDLVETNILFAKTKNGSASAINIELSKKGVLAIATGTDEIRFVSNLLVTQEDCQEVCKIIKELEIIE